MTPRLVNKDWVALSQAIYKGVTIPDMSVMSDSLSENTRKEKERRTSTNFFVEKKKGKVFSRNLTICRTHITTEEAERKGVCGTLGRRSQQISGLAIGVSGADSSTVSTAP